MIPNTSITRGIIYASAVLKTAVTPIAFLYYAYYFATEQNLIQIHPFFNTFLHYWLNCELMVYFYFQITRNRMLRILPSVSPSQKESCDLYKVCFANIEDAQSWFLIPLKCCTSRTLK